MLLLLFLCMYAHMCPLWRSELRFNSGTSAKCLLYFSVTREKNLTKESHVNIPVWGEQDRKDGTVSVDI